MANRLMAGLVLTLALAACASNDPDSTSATQQSAPVNSPPNAEAAASVAPQNTAASPPGRAVTADNDTVIVPGSRERQVQAPNGDPRSTQQRMEDIRAWDTCVMRVQGAAESNPTRPALDTPEDVCRRSLGMNDRLALPASRAP